MKKTFCSVILCLFLIAGCAKQQPASAISKSISTSITSQEAELSSATDKVLENSDYKYIIEDGSINLLKYTGTAANVVIPDIIDGFPVKEIGENAFRNNSTIKSVVISDSVISIGASAFESCNALKTVAIGKGVEIINDFSFSNSAIEEIKIESNLKEIGRWAFDDCKNLKLITLPESVVAIGKGAFSKTKLEEFKFPSKVKSVSSFIFKAAVHLKKVTLPAHCEVIDALAFRYTGSLNELFIPDGVIKMSYAFEDCARELVLLYDNNPLVPQYAQENNILCFKRSEYNPVLTVELVNGKPLNDVKNLGISQEDYNLVKRCTPVEMEEVAKDDYYSAIWERTVDNSYISFRYNEGLSTETVTQKLSKTAALLYQCDITQFDSAKKSSYGTDYLDRMTDFAVYVASIFCLKVEGLDYYSKGITGLRFMYDDDAIAYFCGIFDFVPDFSLITGYSKQQWGIWYFPKELPELQTEVLSFSSDDETMEYTLEMSFNSENDNIVKTFSFKLVEHDTVSGPFYRVILTSIK